MKKKILIFGAGSIGNHFTNASLKKNYEVYVTDINHSALKRMKEKIFPLRYKKWNISHYYWHFWRFTCVLGC